MEEPGWAIQREFVDAKVLVAELPVHVFPPIRCGVNHLNYDSQL